jgi:anti-sigma regulatory factor (Ser/Thr protein kinase)
MLRSFKRDLSSLEPLFDFTGDFAAAHQLEEPVVFAMNLAVEELFTNMVKYGGGDDAVSVGLDVRDGDLVIELVHPGADAFDPTSTKVADVTRPLEERRPGGMGLLLVRSMMDSITYEHRNGDACVTLTKHLGRRAGGA